MHNSDAYYIEVDKTPIVKNSESSRDTENTHRKGKKYTQEVASSGVHTSDIKTQKSIGSSKTKSGNIQREKPLEITTTVTTTAHGT